MDACRLFLSLLLMMSTPRGKSEASKSSCLNLDQDFYRLIKGEAFYYVSYAMDDPKMPDENITWYKNGPEIKNITTDETHRIHYHGGALLFLNISANDSGTYTGRHITPSGECFYYHLQIEVFNEISRENLTYGSIKNSDQNKKIPCPQQIEDICTTFNGNFTWFKGANLLPGHHEAILLVENAQKDDEDIYTCICTWTHNHKLYNSSGSRKLFVEEKASYRDVEITSPTSKEQLVDKGVRLKLNCTVYCGINAKLNCKASWRINGEPVNQMKGYNEITKLEIEDLSKNTFSTATLTIERVSAKDFQHDFKCYGSGFYTTNTTTLTLKQRESILPLITAGVCVFLVGVFAAVLLKYFAIDLALLFRPYFLPGRDYQDGRVYDAYVVYQTQSLDKEAEEKLSNFVTKILPSVLEDKCGYRLFIQGRDDIPGEDRVELVERCIKQSRRLIVILTPGSGSEMIKDPSSDHTSVIGGFDWQVGLHHALVQREMSVILIQLGETGSQGYTHLPPGLLHLIRKSAPIRWTEGLQKASKWNSHFWKRVQYLMPATPAKKRDLSTII
ncbi:interleukin-1 receptor-like 1 isoform X2 [Girardinichthys multiradiatus]|uniref:interleukin-1 receptor-like 1 isoform X2 n=1 Tax=Girardinichthys multiradiatus TaxID=208333 RepID=UPI001FAE2793|nr:interleukin-1 receptor-like 1 isoform X2 [Girardinichthys multiradiatus]